MHPTPPPTHPLFLPTSYYKCSSLDDYDYDSLCDIVTFFFFLALPVVVLAEIFVFFKSEPESMTPCPPSSYRRGTECLDLASKRRLIVRSTVSGSVCTRARELVLVNGEGYMGETGVKSVTGLVERYLKKDFGSDIRLSPNYRWQTRIIYTLIKQIFKF